MVSGVFRRRLLFISRQFNNIHLHYYFSNKFSFLLSDLLIFVTIQRLIKQHNSLLNKELKNKYDFILKYLYRYITI